MAMLGERPYSASDGAISCIWDAELLCYDISAASNLSPEVLARLHNGDNNDFLDELARLALDTTLTDQIFASFEPIFVELCARWIAHLEYASPLQVVCALARVLPYAPGLAAYAHRVISQSRNELSAMFLSQTSVKQLDATGLEIVSLLTALSRLWDYDSDLFKFEDFLPHLQTLVIHGSAAGKYLAARVMGKILGHSRNSYAEVGQAVVAEEPPIAWLDNVELNFRFFDLWERSRKDRMVKMLQQQRQFRIESCVTPLNSNGQSEIPQVREILISDLSLNAQCIAGHLLLRLSENATSPSDVAMTPSTRANLRLVARAVTERKPVLVTGLAGSGKTMIVNEIAQQLGRAADMLTLHLNEQTDPKLLVGVYTSDSRPGSFRWQPGVLTVAVQEGRFVFIEDIDRAPLEVITILLPLLERSELLVPNLGGYIRAKEGFKLFASKRTVLNARGEEVAVNDKQLGQRAWNRIHIERPSRSDLSSIIQQRYPLLRNKHEIMEMYDVLMEWNSTISSVHQSQASARMVEVQGLFRFCSRYEALLVAQGIKTDQDAVPESLYDSVLLEAADCFCAAEEQLSQRDRLARLLSSKLQLSQGRTEFCLYQRPADLRLSSRHLQVGRARLKRHSNTNAATLSSMSSKQQKFAPTGPVRRLMESVAVAVQRSEPCLLVGETGVGKTTVVQQLASQLGRSLVVANLSQQSEVSDLLGSIKPLSPRVLALPLRDRFMDLFPKTPKENETFVDTLGRALQKEDWPRMIILMERAIRKITKLLEKAPERTEEAPMKKAKLAPSKRDKLRSEWEELDARLQSFKNFTTKGEKGLVFDFVEGKLVSAVKTGTWVLLDEINLATPDTLECLTDLLSSGPNTRPFILLSEMGNVSKIEAHPDFRIFAAMNPATDVGKRDLPKSIRSRFTEYFVHSPDKDVGALKDIVSAHLSDHLKLPKHLHLTQACVNLYVKISELEANNQLVDGSGQRPRFTLRTLTRALKFATDTAHMYNIRTALYHGFWTCFLTVLDTESQQLVSVLINEHILDGRGPAIVQGPIRPPTKEGYVNIENYWIKQGEGIPVVPKDYILTEHVQTNLRSLTRAALTRQYPILLQGPTSSGKTSLIEYLAKRSGNRFVRINNHEHTDLQEYLGAYISTPDGLKYEDGVLVEALKNGHWIVLDELNLAPTDVLEALNRLLDDNRELFVPEKQEVITPHPNFMLFATQNPPGMYGGRKILSRAFRNRFLELHFNDVPEDELEKILKRRCPHVPESFCTRIVQVYRKLAVLRQSERMFEQRNSFATLRDLFRWALRNADSKHQLAINGFMLLGERVRDAKERRAVKQVIEEVMRERIDVDGMYGDAESFASKNLFDTNMDGVIWTQSARRLYLLITKALEHEEPILLVGDTGCGKTRICQVVAAHQGRKLSIVNAHQNTETGDLIGSQRPIRDRAMLEVNMRHTIQQSTPVASQPSVTLEELLKLWDNLSTEDKDRFFSSEAIESMETSRARLKMLFEWQDGSLVTAMKSGDFFLLDEISLADDSVLERLNSVLEPERSILLAEKGSVDDFVQATSSFRFLATMNPAGDYGKKELSPALRNRFTEIWVPRLSPEEDLAPIIEHKLSGQLTEFVAPMLEFSTWFVEKYRDGIKDLSIRDLIAWADFLLANIDHMEAPKAFVHGGLMVYVDGLGANPSARFSTTQYSIAEQRSSCVAQMSIVLKQTIDISHILDLTLVSTADRFGVGSFLLPRAPILQASSDFDLDFNFKASTTRSNTLRLLRALQLAKPILLEGSPGVGKTALITALAKVLGHRLTRINLSDQTDVVDLFGSDVPAGGEDAGQFVWRDAPFLQAMMSGEWVLLDEMNLASQSVLEGLNACLDHRGEVFIPELGRSFKKRDGFTLFAAQNPHSQGGGRKGLPASFVNRFTVVYADELDAADYSAICSTISTHVSQETVSRMIQHTAEAQALANSASFEGGPWEFNLRDILRWINLVRKQDSLLSAAPWTHFRYLLYTSRLRNTQNREALERLFISLDAAETNKTYNYQNLGKTWFQCGFGKISSSGLQHSNSSDVEAGYSAGAMENVLISVQKSWPVLLTGPTGSGKSSMVSRVASLAGMPLVKITLSPETDAFDLLGGYEQVDPTREAAILFLNIRRFVQNQTLSMLQCEQLDHLAGFWAALHGASEPCMRNVETVIHALERLRSTYSNDTLGGLLQAANSLLLKMQRESKAQFAWVDGMLVQALRDGTWIELEHANLCASSVLDRLNALLEPQGVLTVHEYSNPDGSPQRITPHANFRIFLTMDPRYGELSRAMRNRCIEIHLQDNNKELCSVAPNLSSAALFRFQAFQALCNSGGEAGDLNELIRVIFDNLSLGDYELLSEWVSQLQRGLIPLIDDDLGKFRELVEVYHVLWHTETVATLRDELLLALRKRNERFDRWSDGQETISSHPVHPLTNPALLPHGHDERLDHTWLGSILELSVDILHAQLRLSSLTASDEASLTTGKSSNRVTIRHIVIDSCHQILGWLSQSAKDPASGALKSLVYRLCQLQTVLANLAMTSPFNLTDFHTIWRICNTFAKQLQNLGELRELAQIWSEQLSKLRQRLKVSTGGSMELLWRMFGSKVEIQPPMLRFTKEMDALADMFDYAVWRSNLTLSNTVGLRTSMKLLYNEDQLQDWETRLLQLRETLELDQEKNIYTEEPILPHFQREFEGISQYAFLVSSDEGDSETLNVLAGRNTKSSLTFHPRGCNTELVVTLPRMTGIDTENSKLAAVRNYLPLRLLQSLRSARHERLSSLTMTMEELTQLGVEMTKLTDRLAQNSLSLLDSHLVKLQHLILSAHQSLSEDSMTDALSGVLSLLKNHVGVTAVNSIDVSSLNSFDTEQFEVALKTHILPSVKALSNKIHGGDAAQNLECSSFAWTRFFLALLLLYLPNVPYDPASNVAKEIELWIEGRDRARAKIKALKQYEGYLTGNETNLRIELAEADAANMAPRPAAPKVIRPQKNQLQDLHAEMTTILRTIARPVESLFLETNASQRETKLRDLENVSENISSAISRLKLLISHYRDIVSPLIFLLQGLAVGFELSADAIRAREVSTSQDERYAFAISAPQSDSDDMQSQKDPNDLIKAHVLGIKFMLVQKRARNSSSIDCMVQIQKHFECLFDLWQKQLKHEQDQYASKSSLYRYKGVDTLSQEDEEAELQELFHDVPSVTNSGDTHGKIKAPELAVTIAQLHTSVTGTDESLTTHLMELVRSSAANIPAPTEASETFWALQNPAQLIPAVLMEISAAKDDFHMDKRISEPLNFYHDFDPTQTIRLRQLLFKVHDRFMTILTSWPEHATLLDVISSCRTVLGLELYQPLSALLPKVEYLHSLVNQWQTVASKEYSALEVYNEITTLLVDWRRLELSTWRKLLDFEDEKCEREAQAWWFVAYELIIHAPMHINTKAEMEQYIMKMMKELIYFLSSASTGVYSKRLRLLKTFTDYAEQLSDVNLHLKAAVAPLRNLYKYHQRYETAIENTIQEGRKSIAKEMDEAILLASWKDTNIRALRESANKSHRKLLKVVRKYRSVLGQSVESMTAGTSGNTEISRTPKVLNVVPGEALTEQLLSYLRMNSSTLENLPNRFIDISATKGRIGTINMLPSIFQQSGTSLADFCNDLQTEVTALRKETPATWNAEVANQVRQVKSRKKILFAETLKKLRRMGFQPNIDTNTLATQQELSQVLVRGCHHAQLTSADSPFFDFVSHMAIIRTRIKEHSEDITDQEVNRSLGLLESILRTTIMQRRALAGVLKDLDLKDVVLRSLEGLQHEFKNGLAIIFSHSQNPEDDSRKITWTQTLLQFATRVLEEHERSSGQTLSEIKKYLVERLSLLKDINLRAAEVVSLPSDLQTASQLAMHKEVIQHVEAIVGDLKSWGVREPSLQYILGDVADCISSGNLQLSSTEVSNAQVDKPHTSQHNSIAKIVLFTDSILRKFEKVNSIVDGVELSIESHSWLSQTNKWFEDISKMYDTRGIIDGLDSIFKQLQSEEGSVLATSLAFLSLQVPIISELCSANEKLVHLWLEHHNQLCSMGKYLSGLFENMLAQGLCLPTEKSNEKGESGDLEAGTGLGEGEGAEDISHDIEKDEDLSELAQQKSEENDKQEMDAEKDAVDMADEDLEATAEDAEEDNKEEDKDGEEGSDKQDIEEEAADVDDEEDNAVDEKFWDGEKDEEQDTKTSGKQQNNATKEDNEVDEAQDGEENGIDEQESAGNDDNDALDGPSKEEQSLDQFAQEGENLDLPDDMEIDGDKDADMSDDSMMDEMSDGESKDEVDKAEQDGTDEKREQDDDAENTDGDVMDEVQHDQDHQDSEGEIDEKAEDMIEEVSNEQLDDTGAAMDNVEEMGASRGQPGTTTEDMDEHPEEHPEDTSQEERIEAEATPQVVGAESGKDNGDENESGEARQEVGQTSDESREEPYKKLGDALEKWHRLNQEIQQNSGKQTPERQNEEEVGQDTKFEHVPEDDASAEAQALGKADMDQVSALNQEAQKSGVDQERKEHMLEDDSDSQSESDHTMEDLLDDSTLRSDHVVEQESSKLVQDMMKMDPSLNGRQDAKSEMSDDGMDIDAEQPDHGSDVQLRTAEDARRLWAYCEGETRDLALSLTEQLRLILAPTQASKLRGDFRTGKRLNIKRIIAYIASQYKRDKIWMRRSVPSKRNYQILLAVDDSSSMSRGGGGLLALEALALISRSLSMLEVGQICVVGFGRDVRVAHAFDQPFSSEAGTRIFQQFSFSQSKTDVKKLVNSSLDIFREARFSALQGSADLWQLQLIISDGVCDDRDQIRRLVRQAQDERVMTVFVIVDAQKEQSILQMQEASFVPDEYGNPRPVISRYLDSFPFSVYLIVQNVKDLPNVLAMALRQWFAEVADT